VIIVARSRGSLVPSTPEAVSFRDYCLANHLYPRTRRSLNLSLSGFHWFEGALGYVAAFSGGGVLVRRPRHLGCRLMSFIYFSFHLNFLSHRWSRHRLGTMVAHNRRLSGTRFAIPHSDNWQGFYHVSRSILPLRQRLRPLSVRAFCSLDARLVCWSRPLATIARAFSAYLLAGEDFLYPIVGPPCHAWADRLNRLNLLFSQSSTPGPDRSTLLTSCSSCSTGAGPNQSAGYR